MQNYKENFKETLNQPSNGLNYMKFNTGNKCLLLISGHKYKHQWTQIDKDMVGKKIELTVKNSKRQ